MKIVTIMNYDFSDRHNVIMALMWIRSVHKYRCGAEILILSNKELPGFLKSYFLEFDGVSFEIHESLPNLHHNIGFKLHILCNLNFPFIFLDADLVVLKSLSYLFDKQNDKPWVGINHQKNIPGHTGEMLCLNSGVQIVSNPSFYDFDRIMSAEKRNKDMCKTPGWDQRYIQIYFNEIGYDYTHPSIGTEWNACAKYTTLWTDDDFIWHGRVKGLLTQHNVYINHYWWEYNPWRIDCPIYKFYDKYYPFD